MQIKLQGRGSIQLNAVQGKNNAAQLADSKIMLSAAIFACSAQAPTNVKRADKEASAASADAPVVIIVSNDVDVHGGVVPNVVDFQRQQIRRLY